MLIPWILGAMSFAYAVEPAHPDNWVIHAKVYALGDSGQTLLFNLTREQKKVGDDTHITETFQNPDGTVALHTDTSLKNGRFVNYELDQDQTREKGKIDAGNGRLRFEYFTDGKTKKDEEDWKENFILGSTFAPFVGAHWTELSQGKTVPIRFGVPDRLETVGFDLFKERDDKFEGRDVLVIKMKPSSLFIAALVKPLHFYFDKENYRLLKFEGRTLPKKKAGDHFEDLDAVSIFSY